MPRRPRDPVRHRIPFSELIQQMEEPIAQARRNDRRQRYWAASLSSSPAKEPATHNSPLGRRCARHAEELREALRNPRALGNVMAGGRARTEEEIAELVVGLPS